MQTYYIHINEQQREVLQAALTTYIIEGLNNEIDEFNNNVAASLFDMIRPDGLTGPLAPWPCINGLTI